MIDVVLAHTLSGGLRRPSRKDVYIPDPGELYKHPLIGDNYNREQQHTESKQSSGQNKEIPWTGDPIIPTDPLLKITDVGFSYPHLLPDS